MFADVASVAVPAALVIRIIAVGAMLFVRRADTCHRVSMIGSVLASCLTLLAAATVLQSGRAIDGVLLRHSASAIVLGYSVTALSAWFVMVLGIVGIPVAVYSIGYFAHAIAPTRAASAGAAFNVMLGAIEVVFVADGVMAFLFGWEIMTLATAALVAIDHDVASNRRAAYLFLVMSHVGTGCVIAGFLTLAAASGSFAFPVMLAGHVVDGPVRDAVFALFFVGFGIKAGLIPFHIWLPEAHPAAPSSISAFMSAVLITAGLYGLIRVCVFGLGVPDASWALWFMATGTLSAILGVLYALTQTDLKRLLAYSTIENSGIIVLGAGAAMFALAGGQSELATVAVAASLMHTLNHAVFKGLLFLGAGSVVMSAGTRQIEQLGGLVGRMPRTALCFLIGAMAISGLPLLNGFPSEWMTFQSLLLGFTSTAGLLRLTYPLSGALLALTSALAAACFVRVFGISFLARPRSSAASGAHEVPAMMWGPQAYLAALCVVLGLFPGLVLQAVRRVLISLPGLQPALLLTDAGYGVFSGLASFDFVRPGLFAVAFLGGLGVAVLVTRRRTATRRVATWGCGGELTGQTEYTATAFSKPLTMIFQGIYRPTRQVDALAAVSPYFPQEVRYRAAIEPPFERHVYGPLLRMVVRAASGMRVLQAGSLHSYLAYVLVLAVILLTWLGGSS